MGRWFYRNCCSDPLGSRYAMDYTEDGVGGYSSVRNQFENDGHGDGWGSHPNDFHLVQSILTNPESGYGMGFAAGRPTGSDPCSGKGDIKIYC